MPDLAEDFLKYVINYALETLSRRPSIFLKGLAEEGSAKACRSAGRVGLIEN